MNLFKILIAVFVLVCASIASCKAPKTMEQPMTVGHYLVHLNEGYNQYDLRAMLGRNADKILPSSKSESIFLIHLVGDAEQIEEVVSDLKDNKAILSINSASTDAGVPTTGTNSDMKKTKRLGDM